MTETGFKNLVRLKNLSNAALIEAFEKGSLSAVCGDSSALGK